MNFADRSDVTRAAYPRTTKTTMRMSRDELARVVANHQGYLVGPGGHIYTPTGNHICQGYALLGERLERRGCIVVGKGIDWTRVGRHDARGVRLTGSAT